MNTIKLKDDSIKLLRSLIKISSFSGEEDRTKAQLKSFLEKERLRFLKARIIFGHLTSIFL